MKLLVIFAFFIVIWSVPGFLTAKIAVLYPGGSKSDLIAAMPIVEELAQRGHDVTIVSPFKMSTENSIRLIHLAELEKRIESLPIDWFGMSDKGWKFVLIFVKKKYIIDKHFFLKDWPKYLL
jgi:glucuronosyltransferase